MRAADAGCLSQELWNKSSVTIKRITTRRKIIRPGFRLSGSFVSTLPPLRATENDHLTG
jgi:hypothetical protein